MRPLVIAHRGASWDEPENTLAAFTRAIELGADYVELDVHAAPDGRLVVAHQPPADPDRVPTLEEALGVIGGRVGVMVELKRAYRYRRHDVVRRTVELLGEEDVLVSFEPWALRQARRLRPELRVVQHVACVPVRFAAGYAWAAGFEDSRATPRALALAQRLGLATTVYTVNEPVRMRELAALGVTGIFTDRPDVVRSALTGLAG